jgi:hypothetical protein
MRDEGLPAQARGRRHHFARRDEHQIAVVVAAPELALDRHMGDGGHDLGPGPVAVGPEQQVACAQPKPDPVADQIAHRDQIVQLGLRQGEAGQIGPHRLIPLHLALIDQNGQSGAGDSLGVGGDGEQCVLIHRLGLALLPDAIAARQHRRPVLDQGHRQRRLIGEGRQRAHDIAVHLLGQRRPVIGRRLRPGPCGRKRCASGPQRSEQGGAAVEADGHEGAPENQSLETYRALIWKASRSALEASASAAGRSDARSSKSRLQNDEDVMTKM